MLTRFGVLALATALFMNLAPAQACPFCSVQGQTLSGEVAQADFILYGTLSNAKPAAQDAFSGGTTDLTIEQVIKPHDFVKGKKVITLPRFIPVPKEQTKFLVFFYYTDGKIDPYRGEQVRAESKLPEYIKGAMEVKGKDALTRMKYFFNYLESPDLTIGGDAYNEVGTADYKEVRALAETLKPETLLKWLKDPNTRASRYGLYGLMLGHCGKPEDAKELRKMLEDPDRAFSSGLDGLLAGYILLDPREGWSYLLDFLKDPKKDFAARYAALKTVRFFWEYRSDVIGHKQELDAIRLLLAQPDIADLPIEDLRKWGAWNLTDAVLALADVEAYNRIPIVKRAILKFAISATPVSRKAAEFVEAARRADRKKVEFMEELLRDEQKPTTSSATPPAKTGG